MRVAPAIFLLTAALAVRAQDTPPAAAPPPQPTPPPVLENTGRPMRLPFSCTDEDIQSAGLTCTEEDPCPVYLELTTVDAVGTRIFLAGNLHSASVTLFSTLLASEDGGHTWREPFERVRSAGLDRIQFHDQETGWAAGEVLSPLPQDPFLLLTTDAGKTWRQRAIFGENAENRLGSIQQFVFTDKTSGSLIIDRGQGSETDRYEMYESPDGGESWTVKETSSKPLRLRRPPPVVSDWRVRVDAPSQAFHVEHRQGERWGAVASFQVKLAACKPQSGGQ
jgi:photosystem II stability/assembly factor-like uncharacterized protein